MPDTQNTIKEYARLHGLYRKAVLSYTGTSTQTSNLLEYGAQLETLVVAYANASGINDFSRAEFELAGQVPLNIDFSYWDGFNKAVTSLTSEFSAIYRDSGLAGLLDDLKARGVIVNPARLPIIPPAEGEVITGSGKGVNIEFEPRLVWIIEALLKESIASDHIFIEPGIPANGTVRKEPYILINLPGYGQDGRQIALCNQKGEVTFISDHIYAPEFYARHTKQELKALPGIRPVILRDRETWEETILTFLKDGLAPGDVTTPDIQISARRQRDQRIRLTQAMIFQKALHSSLNLSDPYYQCFPSSGCTEPIEGWKGWRWHDVDSTFARDLKGLPGVIRAEIIEQSKKWFEQNTGYPKDDQPPKDATLPDYPEATFGHIDKCYKNMHGKGKTSLWRLLTQAGVIYSVYISPAEMTPSRILSKVLELSLDQTSLFHKRFPSAQFREEVSGWRDWDWTMIDSHAAHNLGVQGLSDLIRNEIARQTQKWFEQHKDHARNQEPPAGARLPDYPDISFGHIDTCYRNMPSKGRTSLWRVLVQTGVIEGTYISSDEMTRERILEKVLKLSLDETGSLYKRFPGVQSKEQVPGWREWSWQAVGTHAIHALAETGLAGTIRSGVIEQARKWLEANKNYQPTQDLPADAELPDYPGVTFGHVDTCFKNNPTSGRNSLWLVLVQAGIIQGTYIKPEEMTRDRIFSKIVELSQNPENPLYERFPVSETKGEIPGWKGWGWRAIYVLARDMLGTNGLSGLISGGIADQTQKWFQRNKNHPHNQMPPMDAELPDYPGVTFSHIAKCYSNARGCRKTSLQDILLESGVLCSIEGRGVVREPG